MGMIRASRLVLAAAALAVLPACATMPDAARPLGQAQVQANPDIGGATGETSVYGLYLAGHAALDAGDSRAAAELFGRASQKNPDAVYLKDPVFTAALMSGDVTRAAEIAPSLDTTQSGARVLAALTRSVEALASGRGEEAYQELDKAGDIGRSDPAAPLLKPWAAAAAGRTETSIAVPVVRDRLTRLVAQIDQGLLLERARRYAEAETTFKALLGDHAALALVATSYGPFLERRGRRPEAVALYDQVLAVTPDDPDIAQARARAASKGPAPSAPSPREGAAQALLAPAAVVISDKEQELGLVYLRLILRLDPGQSEAWLLLGDSLNSLGDQPGARNAYAQVSPKSGHYVEARTRLAWSWQNDDKDLALKLAQETVQQRPSSQDAKVSLADLLRADEKFEESAKVLDPLIAAAGNRAEWRLYYMRGVALERAGHWPEAERDLQQALTLRPNSPEVLNYLGYSWVNRGTRVKEGLAMIEKALLAQPDEGAYVDSLGWAYFRLGDYKKALEYLERAALLDAGDAEINDHLGDVYWRLGRKDEAKFQWRSVLTFKPSAEVKARVETKLASPDGLDALTRSQSVASQ
jgi:Flp pilus assembly protein TadD